LVLVVQVVILQLMATITEAMVQVVLEEQQLTLLLQAMEDLVAEANQVELLAEEPHQEHRFGQERFLDIMVLLEKVATVATVDTILAMAELDNLAH
jgi:hypothetical protein